MNKKKLNGFIMDIEALHKSVEDKVIKEHLCIEFEKIKKKHLHEKEKPKLNLYDEVEKMMYENRRERVEVIPVNMEEFGAPCDNNTRAKRIESVNKKLENMEGEPLLISLLKGQLLCNHKRAIGIKAFIKFLADSGENYDYATFLIKFYKLAEKYKGLKRCKLSVRFIKAKFAIIKEICINNSKDWE